MENEVEYNARVAITLGTSLNLVFENECPDGVRASLERAFETGEFLEDYAEEIGDAVLRSLRKYPHSIKLEVEEIEEV